jgi:hypothetical protein
MIIMHYYLSNGVSYNNDEEDSYEEIDYPEDEEEFENTATLDLQTCDRCNRRRYCSTMIESTCQHGYISSKIIDFRNYTVDGERSSTFCKDCSHERSDEIIDENTSHSVYIGMHVNRALLRLPLDLECYIKDFLPSGPIDTCNVCPRNMNICDKYNNHY